ncbi:GNAT family N-acetyltransferase [Flavobacterium frigoris]|uniref:Transcriptional regulator, MarR family protein n=1 Tax=Flavobacterium frigoris (strain PS1) TaxID=1086011 RepID=H7FVC7_FLAFP|nr:GNAT family N-acetyltransferase [Flavobacterium frigoris]EIA07550.1 transcriptional regulator, MarR family protein [Flavobacterium frigoris PS1]
MNIDNTVTIIPFSSDLTEPIKTLNIEWLKKYFKIEPKDEKVLSNPQEEIIDKGGMIFYAKYNGKIVGTVSLIKVTDTVFELSKMAVTDDVQGLGIGKKLLQHCVDIAQEQGIQKIILYSNKGLKPAIHLYERFGFVEVLLEDGVYERADIKMEKIIS